jgi:hypothetical protein
MYATAKNNKSYGFWKKDQTCILQVDDHFEFQMGTKRHITCGGQSKKYSYNATYI